MYAIWDDTTNNWIVGHKFRNVIDAWFFVTDVLRIPLKSHVFTVYEIPDDWSPAWTVK